MKDFRKLDLWNKSHRFTLGIYDLARSFPKEELFGVTSQLRRLAASVPANIAEGCGKSSDADFARYLQNAFGSAWEVEYHLILANDLRYLSKERFDKKSVELIEMKRCLRR